ncbi:MAG: hypothetical protein HY315_07655 [Acidobacteria bacterium]|nr:hypothetical protein [Acidobacteriota bacterium]
MASPVHSTDPFPDLLCPGPTRGQPLSRFVLTSWDNGDSTPPPEAVNRKIEDFRGALKYSNPAPRWISSSMRLSSCFPQKNPQASYSFFRFPEPEEYCATEILHVVLDFSNMLSGRGDAAGSL